MIAFSLLPYQDNWPSNWRLIVNQLDAITFTNNHIEAIIRNFGTAAKKHSWTNLQSVCRRSFLIRT